MAVKKLFYFALVLSFLLQTTLSGICASTLCGKSETKKSNVSTTTSTQSPTSNIQNFDEYIEHATSHHTLSESNTFTGNDVYMEKNVLNECTDTIVNDTDVIISLDKTNESSETKKTTSTPYDDESNLENRLLSTNIIDTESDHTVSKNQVESKTSTVIITTETDDTVSKNEESLSKECSRPNVLSESNDTDHIFFGPHNFSDMKETDYNKIVDYSKFPKDGPQYYNFHFSDTRYPEKTLIKYPKFAKYLEIETTATKVNWWSEMATIEHPWSLTLYMPAVKNSQITESVQMLDLFRVPQLKSLVLYIRVHGEKIDKDTVKKFIEAIIKVDDATMASQANVNIIPLDAPDKLGIEYYLKGQEPNIFKPISGYTRGYNFFGYDDNTLFSAKKK